jgi:hypothetical protein
MRYLRKIRITPATVIATAALFVALAGGSYAAVQALPRNSVTTVQVKNGSLLAVDFKKGQIPRGPRGLPGPDGPAGPAGPAGPPGPSGSGGASAKWALVSPTGTVIASSGGITVTTHSTGETILDFGGAVTGKLILASGSLATDTGGRGSVVASPCGGTGEGVACSSGNDTSHVIVRTYAKGNSSLEDHAFYVAVFG